jgi:O-antigen ligase
MTSVALSLAAITSVLAFGGVEIWGFLPAQLLLLAAACRQFWRKGWPALSRRPALIIAVVAAIPLLQLMPLPEELLSVLSPGRPKLAHAFAASGVAVPLASGISLVPHQTTLSLLRLYCYLLAFLLAYQNAGSRPGRRSLRWVLLVLALIEATYGLFQYLTGWQYIYNYAKTSSFTSASGTYINYNHFAGLLEMALPFLVVQLWLRSPHGNVSRTRYWREILSGPNVGRWLFRLGLLLVVVMALIFSESRSGILAGIVGMIVAATLTLPGNTKRSSLLSILLIAGLMVVASAWIGLWPVLTRFQDLSRGAPAEEARITIWQDTTALIRDFPILGSGLGTYPTVSLHYQTIPVTVRYDHAHNDYLEFAADIGIPGALLLFCGLWALTIHVARKSLSANHGSDRRLAAACAGSLMALLLHSLTDFNLQIPANALIFSWIAGTAAGIVQSAPRRTVHGKVLSVQASTVSIHESE